MAHTTGGSIPQGFEYEHLAILAKRARAGNNAAYRALSHLPDSIQRLAWAVEPEWPDIVKSKRDYDRNEYRPAPEVKFVPPPDPPASSIPADIAANWNRRDDQYAYDPNPVIREWRDRQQQQEQRY